ncbi:response regulator transcription factor [Paenibacillus lycopersici]|uniref:Response regulator transcription factor n=1 Tax=Paenibacillus lycopersici TaxID=2704462 RepID=A0A6C0FWB6_9BACL|nr:LytTR family DNA-binding domain-containing protein [Paenibacillus lycopersici]QHT61416.1 response regulator transcription factor [Paenibacillus lycopersici]
MHLKFAICDDEQVETNYLSALAAGWAQTRNHTAEIRTFGSAEAFLFHYADDKSADILLLDIEMGAMNGIELAHRIRQDNESIQILFITGYSDFMAYGYEVSALHYLMKPVNEDKLFDVLDKAVRQSNKSDKAIMLTVGGESVRIPHKDILCVEAIAHSVIVTTQTGRFEAKLSLSEIGGQLSRQEFSRCHRSYIVGLKWIKRITKTDIVLDNDMSVPLARRSYGEVNQAFIRFYKVDG